jgi:hypothetical protein
MGRTIATLAAVLSALGDITFGRLVLGIVVGVVISLAVF